ncbi:hypothetical protein CTAM01_08405 [Colletotrichum tamarilloi]|uniref:Uncharacterized protein n=1 Tax=Colletotrichum tamarilloi TaxID=1209934 RepID=A0ABQ9R6D5_9PEZI|nr:uncharacterized protein CTAM01_08405 [Colletotrichum tamarilloi]KAK1496218.1 hypothetical protein CTAM01_08405 [Colletotrichum tamarilloi]
MTMKTPENGAPRSCSKMVEQFLGLVPSIFRQPSDYHHLFARLETKANTEKIEHPQWKPIKMVHVCCIGISSKKKGQDEDAKAKEADPPEDTQSKDRKAKNAKSKEKIPAQVPKQPLVELIKLPPPAKLPGSNYNMELMLSGTNTGGSITSSQRSYMRSPELDFIPDPTEVEYVSDHEDQIEAPRRSGPWSRLSRRRSNNSNKRSDSPDSDKRVSIISIQRPSSNPAATEIDGSPQYDQAAYTYSVRQNNMRRIQADLESEHSSRSVTPGSKRFRGLETVVEVPGDHQSERQSGPRPRSGIEVEIPTDVSVVDVTSLPQPPPAAKLSNEGVKVHPIDITTGDRRRSSCPKPETSTKVTATNLVLRERGSLPDMPPPAPILPARQSRADQDDESFRTWRLSQCIPHCESQMALSLQPQNIPLPLDAESTAAFDDKEASEAQFQDGSSSNGATLCDMEKPDGKLATEPVGISQPPRTSESAQSQDGSGWETWLLAEKLSSQEDFVTAQDLDGKKKFATAVPSRSSATEAGDEKGTNRQHSSPISFPLQEISGDKPYADLPLKDDLEVKTTLFGRMPLQANEPSHYPSSSVYSSMQNTRTASPSGFKNISGDDDRNSLAESLIDLDLANFDCGFTLIAEASISTNKATVYNLKEQHSDESYRTALDKNPDSDTAVPSIILSGQEVAGADGICFQTENYHNYGTARNVPDPKNEKPGSVGGIGGISGESQIDLPSDGYAPSRKSSFLQFLGIRRSSSTKNRWQSHSQSSTEPAQLNSSSVANQMLKPRENIEMLSSHSITSSTQHVPNDVAFTAPKLTESATVVWQRAFKVEHDQRETKSTTYSKKSAMAKASMGTISVDENHLSHPTERDLVGYRYKETKAQDFIATRNASQSSTSQQSFSGPDDDMTPKDFAAVPGAETAQYVELAGKTSMPSVVEIKKSSQSMSKKLGKAMKTSLGKMMPSKPGVKSSAQLEYPELEILPTKEGYKDLEALQSSIETLKGSEHAKMAINPALAIAELENQPASSLDPLPARLHEAEHARHESANDTANTAQNDVALESKNAHKGGTEVPTIRPVTPANMIMLPAGDSTTATTEQWATPASRLSYTTALDENDAGHLNRIWHTLMMLRKSKECYDQKRWFCGLGCLGKTIQTGYETSFLYGIGWGRGLNFPMCIVLHRQKVPRQYLQDDLNAAVTLVLVTG